MQNLLELKGASRRVSDRFSLRDVSLSVEPGQIVGFVGANGAGKTTTIRAALGLIKLDAGEVRLLGQKCSAGASNELQRNARSRIGLVLDACPLPFHAQGCRDRTRRGVRLPHLESRNVPRPY